MSPSLNTRLRVRLCTRWTTAVAVTVACGLGLFFSTASAASRGCDQASVAAARLPMSTVRATVQCLINEQRAKFGLPPLRNSNRLDNMAQVWVNTLVAIDAFTHGDFTARLRSAGVSYSVAGEDLASGQLTPRQVVAAWMASADHCRNILAPVYTRFGGGENPHGIRPFATGPSTWAEEFDLPLGKQAPSRNWGPAKGCPY